jgi:hypothetical protein
VSLTDAGSVGMAALVGPRVTTLTGRLLSSEDSALTLSVQTTTKRNGVDDLWNGETVIVRREYVSSIQQRSFSLARSLASGGIVAALGGVLYGALGGGGVSGTTSGGRPPGTH